MARSGLVRRILIVIGLTLTLVVPLAQSLPGIRPLLVIPGFAPQESRELLWWVLVVFMLFYVVFIERRSLSSVGLRRPTWKTLVFGVLAAVVIIAGVGFLVYLVLSWLHIQFNQAALGKLMALPYWLRVLIVLRAGIAEELFFRGYGIERLQELTGSKAVAAVVTLTIFTVAHLGFWGWSQLLIAGGAGLVLTLLYLWRRDLVCNMIAHFLTDAVGVLLR